ncbi:MAG: chloride channel protein [Cytophagales bacterium]|uniref:chloride channel protein n=1 Tax=Cyclobacterium marinum TaxID=104 RepID=UPI0030DD41EC|nr:chloride channel protein [Cytophagales bacterium]|tara:strand:- start:21860 stop:23707 length:1848 start_codon:yes stop_codon:yes gene_type:complete
MNRKVKILYINFLQFKKNFIQYPYRKFNFIELFLIWVSEKLTRSQFLVLSGILVGLSAGSAGVILKVFVHYIQSSISTDVPFEERLLIYGIFPLIGITLTAFIVKYFFNGDEEKEISFILKDISKKQSKVKITKMYSQILQSGITVGFGGSVGLETPIAVTGSAIGSNYAQRYRLGFKERTLLLAAGAAAGISAAFNAPIAGIMFAFEIILTGLVFTDFIPLVIASICGSLLSTIILNEDILFNFQARETFNHFNVIYFLGLGVLTGFYSRYFLVVGQYVHRFFERFKKKMLLKALLGGLMLSVLCVLFPPLFGEGYINIRTIYQGNVKLLIEDSLFSYFGNSEVIIIVFLSLTILLKALATSITLYSGGNGGNFAPSLMAGGLLGFVFGFSLELMGFTEVPTTNLMLVGMAGVMSGAMYAPLTAIFLIAESSSGYDLFIPLMIVSVISYLINRSFSPINPSFKELAERGDIFTTRQDQNILSHISLKDCINPSSVQICTTDSMEEVLHKFRNSDQNSMAVVDVNNQFWGLLNREQLRPFLLNKESAEGTSVSQLAIAPPFIISPNDSVMEVTKMFDEADVWQLPLLNEERNFMGFISRSKILTNYRALLRDYSE